MSLTQLKQHSKLFLIKRNRAQPHRWNTLYTGKPRLAVIIEELSVSRTVQLDAGRNPVLGIPQGAVDFISSPSTLNNLRALLRPPYLAVETRPGIIPESRKWRKLLCGRPKVTETPSQLRKISGNNAASPADHYGISSMYGRCCGGRRR